MRPLFWHVGWCEVYRDPSCRKTKPNRRQSRSNPFAAFANCFIGEAYDRKRRKPRSNKYLNLDLLGVDALERNRGHLRKHCPHHFKQTGETLHP